MSAVAIVIIVVLAVIVILAAMAIAAYDNFVKLRKCVDDAWSQINAQLRCRLDLAPNLVETVKDSTPHRSRVSRAVTKACAACEQAKNVEERADAESQLSSELAKCIAAGENNPGLKTDISFIQLQNELSVTEDKIRHVCQNYNDVAMKYNNAIRRLPGRIVAKAFRFMECEPFDVALGTSASSKVRF